MPNPLLVFRVGDMEAYDGPGPIRHGGSYPETTGDAGEMWNFLPEPGSGRNYGYVMTRDFAGIDLNRLTPKANGRWEENDELQNVDVVFIARGKNGRQVVVGWYIDATVFHKAYRTRPIPYARRYKNWKRLRYLCEVASENATLLRENKREFPVPYAPAHGKGYPGQANVWYPPHSKQGSAVASEIRRYIQTHTRGKLLSSGHLNRGRGWQSHLDKATILKIEEASMKATEKHFCKKGFKIKRVHTDCRGWDLEARKDQTFLQLEVKGHRGEVIQFELTPNEYEKLKQFHKTYRVCVVRQALERSEVEVYVPKRLSSGDWTLKEERQGSVVELGERVGARASERAI